ncbi:MAG TPA: cyclic-phosphate processing receiver domain-containing protein [Pyrinomonadaceae bacterium]|nr:cyclic-phosphate processing receiver domain-containing protein [Pyrinomonadaceae bacterium]
MAESEGEDAGGRVLIVEDDEGRCAWFRERLAGRRLDVTCDVATALGWLARRDYAAILLDHDLAPEHYFTDQPDDERTGYAVARWLAANPTRQRDALIVIHSLNYPGALRMLELLQDSGRAAEHIPFPYLQSGLRL